jgi:3-deoxy-7-phosphoheptulonate synthase
MIDVNINIDAEVSNLNIKEYDTLRSPVQIIEHVNQMVLNDKSVDNIDKIIKTVVESREVVRNIIDGKDKRLLLIIGPCSIHDTKAGYDYAKRLNKLRKKHADKLYIVMRTYFEKPRSGKGWKGLINDPMLNDSCDINTGLIFARYFLMKVLGLGIPVTCEFLEPISAQYIADLVTWGAIGARTTESQIHRQLASGLSCPIGFKNGTGGDIDMAINAINFSHMPQTFLGINEDGQSSIVKTKGNKYSHMVLRGGQEPNYEVQILKDIIEQMQKKKCVREAIIMDCSHGNSNKSWKQQLEVVKYIADRFLAKEEFYIKYVSGLMIESFIEDGNQVLEDKDTGKYKEIDDLVYGQSITDECIGWSKTIDILDYLANSL